MLKMGLFAAAAMLTLISASPAEQDSGGTGQAAIDQSRSPLGDESRALDPADNDPGPGPGGVPTTTIPADGPEEAGYPPCSASLRDRCIQGGGHYASRRSHRSYAMAGERG
jgi:hypothetical protein